MGTHLSISLVHRYRNAHTGERRSFVIGVVVFLVTAGTFIALFLKPDRRAWSETGTAVGGIMSIVAVTLGAIALWNTIDSNSALSSRADRIFESKLQFEEAIALFAASAEVSARYPGASSELVKNSLKAVEKSGNEGLTNGIFRLLMGKDDPERFHIDSSLSLQFIVLMHLVTTSIKNDPDSAQVKAALEIALKLRQALSEVTYTDIRRSLHLQIEHVAPDRKSKQEESSL